MGVTPPPPVAGYGTDCQYNFQPFHPCLVCCSLLLASVHLSKETHSPFLLPCVIEYESVPTDLYVFLHYSTGMTSRNLMFHTLYSMHQIYSIESPINTRSTTTIVGLAHTCPAILTTQTLLIWKQKVYRRVSIWLSNSPNYTNHNSNQQSLT